MPLTDVPLTDVPLTDVPLTIAITGATGLIGSALAARLTADGHVVRRVTRRPRAPGDVAWDPDAGTLDPRALDPRALDGIDAAVHLAGESVDERWTAANRAAIRDSRALGTRLLAETLSRLGRPPRVLVSASAIGYYGDRGDEWLDEMSAPGDGFLADVCRQWEAATVPAEQAGVRVVRTRFGPVLAPRGGLLRRLLPPFRLGLGGRLGDGRAWMSCIALDDLVSAVVFALATGALVGPVNVVGPAPVRNAEFTDALGRVLHRPAPFVVPAPALRLVMGTQWADEMALASQRVAPRALLGAGFRFARPTIDDALRGALDASPGRARP